MKIHRQWLLWGWVALGALHPASRGDAAEEPRSAVERVLAAGVIHRDGEPMKLSEAGRKTLEILRAEKFDRITIDPAEPEATFKLFVERLSKKGVKVRLKRSETPREYKAGEPLRLRNIPMDVLMGYFDQAVSWGWIVYPDGSITYLDYQCACCWPKAGSCHEGQYEAGSPEVMDKEAEGKAAEGKAVDNKAHASGG